MFRIISSILIIHYIEVKHFLMQVSPKSLAWTFKLVLLIVIVCKFILTILLFAFQKLNQVFPPFIP
jgi:hypothetical protein